MSDLDIMPFGKHKGKPMSDVPKSYGVWLSQQDGFKEKNPDMWAYFNGAPTTPRPAQVDLTDTEIAIMSDAPPDFRTWWGVAYGARLRRDGEILYIAHLRVALTAWNAALGVKAAQPKSGPPTIDDLIALKPARVREPEDTTPHDPGKITIHRPKLKPEDYLNEDVPF